MKIPSDFKLKATEIQFNGRLIRLGHLPLETVWRMFSFRRGGGFSRYRGVRRARQDQRWTVNFGTAYLGSHKLELCAAALWDQFVSAAVAEPWGTRLTNSHRPEPYVHQGVGYIPCHPDRWFAVDEQDFTKVAGHHWTLRRGLLTTGGRERLFAHRQVLQGQLGPRDLVVPLDGDRFNLRRANLKIVDRPQLHGQRRKTTTARTSSRFKGVSFHGTDLVWTAAIRARGVTHRLGSFKSEELAAQAYDQAARTLWGECAAVNFPGPGEVSCLRQAA